MFLWRSFATDHAIVLVLQGACPLLCACYALWNFAFCHVFMLVSGCQTSWSCVAVLLLLLNSRTTYNNAWNASIWFVAKCSFLLSKSDNVEPACDGRGVSEFRYFVSVFLTSAKLTSFSNVFEKRSFVNRANTQQCIVKIQFNIVSIAASQHVVFTPHPAVCFILIHNSVLRCFRRPLFLSFL